MKLNYKDYYWTEIEDHIVSIKIFAICEVAPKCYVKYQGENYSIYKKLLFRSRKKAMNYFKGGL